MSNSAYAPEPLKVRGDTDTGSFSKSLRLSLEEHGRITVRAMGPHAANQMLKGLIVATKDLAAQGKLLMYRHAFHTSMEAGNEITAIQTVCTLADLPT